MFGYFIGQLLAKSAYIEAELALTSQDHSEQVLAACQVRSLSIELFSHECMPYLQFYFTSFWRYYLIFILHYLVLSSPPTLKDCIDCSQRPQKLWTLT